MSVRVQREADSRGGAGRRVFTTWRRRRATAKQDAFVKAWKTAWTDGGRRRRVDRETNLRTRKTISARLGSRVRKGRTLIPIAANRVVRW